MFQSKSHTYRADANVEGRPRDINRMLVLALLGACSVLTFLFVHNMGREGKIAQILPAPETIVPGTPVFADIPTIKPKSWFGSQVGLKAFWDEIDQYAITNPAKLETQLAKYNETTEVLTNCGAQYQASRSAYYKTNRDNFFEARRLNANLRRRGEDSQIFEQTLKGLKAAQFKHGAKSLLSGNFEDAAADQNIIPTAENQREQRRIELREHIADPAFCPQVNAEAAGGELDIILP